MKIGSSKKQPQEETARTAIPRRSGVIQAQNFQAQNFGQVLEALEKNKHTDADIHDPKVWRSMIQGCSKRTLVRKTRAIGAGPGNIDIGKAAALEGACPQCSSIATHVNSFSILSGFLNYCPWNRISAIKSIFSIVFWFDFLARV